MSIIYNIYANDGLGGLIDYSAPIGSTSGLSFSPPALTAPSDNTFAVRAFDTILGLEESNTDARVRIVIDSGGNDLTGRPNAPNALTASPTANGGCAIAWAYNSISQGGAPTGFQVFLTAGAEPGYATPAASTTFAPGTVGYSCGLSGLVDGVLYTVAVRGFNAVGVETNTTAVTQIVGDATPPNNVDQLVASTTFNH